VGGGAAGCGVQQLQALLLTGFTTPMVMHWCWNEDGVFSARRAQPFLGTGFIDFAGSGVVHMVGGLAGVTGAYVAGQRHDENGVLRFDSMRARDFIGHNAIYSTLGMFVLWVGWYGFNAGSTRQIVGSTDTVGRVFINTTLATAFSTITTFAWESRHGYALASCLNGCDSNPTSVDQTVCHP
jgi:Amt family ammonium transporter